MPSPSPSPLPTIWRTIVVDGHQHLDWVSVNLMGRLLNKLSRHPLTRISRPFLWPSPQISRWSPRIFTINKLSSWLQHKQHCASHFSGDLLQYVIGSPHLFPDSPYFPILSILLLIISKQQFWKLILPLVSYPLLPAGVRILLSQGHWVASLRYLETVQTPLKLGGSQVGWQVWRGGRALVWEDCGESCSNSK